MIHRLGGAFVGGRFGMSGPVPQGTPAQVEQGGLYMRAMHVEEKSPALRGTAWLAEVCR